MTASRDFRPQVRSGLFIPGDHWVDNERLMRALLVACQRAGVRVEAGCAVHKFHDQRRPHRKHHRGKRCQLYGQNLRPGGGMLVRRNWPGELGIHVPVTPCCGQMMEFEVQRELPFVVRCGIHYLVPRPERRLLVGTTAEYTGFEKAVTAKGLLSILEGAVRLARQVGEFRFLRAWAGLRP